MNLRKPGLPLLLLLIACLLPITASALESVCYGRVAKGRLEHGVKLPQTGSNFSVYSTVGSALGRTYVHSKVATILLTAFTEIERTMPGKVFVYGETGWEKGGRIRPHRTHQNGLSVDFMVPVVDSRGQSIPLPGNALNKFGYDLEFDAKGQHKNLHIDFEAIAEHLYQLHQLAKANKAGIALVIFDPPYLPLLYATKRGDYLKKNIKFMQGKAWIRHDEHYHVDFAVPCKP